MVLPAVAAVALIPAPASISLGAGRLHLGETVQVELDRRLPHTTNIV